LTRAELEELSRRELQALAKKHGVKANQKTVELVDALAQMGEKEPEVRESEPVTENGDSLEQKKSRKTKTKDAGEQQGADEMEIEGMDAPATDAASAQPQKEAKKRKGKAGRRASLTESTKDVLQSNETLPEEVAPNRNGASVANTEEDAQAGDENELSRSERKKPNKAGKKGKMSVKTKSTTAPKVVETSTETELSTGNEESVEAKSATSRPRANPKKNVKTTELEEGGQNATPKASSEAVESKKSTDRGPCKAEKKPEERPATVVKSSRAKRKTLDGTSLAASTPAKQSKRARLAPDLEDDKENKAVSSVLKSARKGAVKDRFAKAHERMFQTQTSILEHNERSKTPLRASRAAPRTARKPSALKSAHKPDPFRSAKPSRRSTSKLAASERTPVASQAKLSVADKSTAAHEHAKKAALLKHQAAAAKTAAPSRPPTARAKFDLQASLKRPVNWKMKTGKIQ